MNWYMKYKSINSDAVSVHVCHLSVYRCMTCLAAGVVAVVGTKGRILQRSMRACSGGATAAVRMTQALAVLLMYLKHKNTEHLPLSTLHMFSYSR